MNSLKGWYRRGVLEACVAESSPTLVEAYGGADKMIEIAQKQEKVVSFAASSQINKVVDCMEIALCTTFPRNR